MDPLTEHLKGAFRTCWAPGPHLTIDETIQRFTGRAAEIVNIPSKPIPEGHKIWVLADFGYVIDFLFHAKGSKPSQGPIGLKKTWTEVEGFLKTESVVLELAQRLNPVPFWHILWLDNLFTSERLLTRLKLLGFGGAGTVGTAHTERELIELVDGSTAQKREGKKSKNRGLDPLLVELRGDWVARIP